MCLSVLYSAAYALIPAEVYPILQGIWTANSEGEMDIFMNFGAGGDFELSVVPAFEFQGMTAEEQSAIIKDCVASTGYFKILKITSSSPNIKTETEILLNGETATNTVTITSNQIYLGGELFLTKESFK